MQKKRESLLTMTGVLIRFYCICQVASNDAKIWKEEIFGPVLSGPKINHLAFFAPCSCEENRSFAKTGSGHNRKKENPTKLHHHHHHSSTGKQPTLPALCSMLFMQFVHSRRRRRRCRWRTTQRMDWQMGSSLR